MDNSILTQFSSIYLDNAFTYTSDGAMHEFDVSCYYIPIATTTPTLNVSCEDSNSHYPSSINLKYINGVYVLHCEDGPALSVYFTNRVMHRFYINGYVVPLEDLPCDDEIKLILKIKHGTPSDAGFRYVDYYHE